MDKNFVIWKQIRCKDSFGEDIYLQLAEEIDSEYRRTLLSRILSMPQKRPISFEQSMIKFQLACHDAFRLGLVGTEPGHYQWYAVNFIDWISEQGYHIVLTGDEFTHVENYRPV